MVKSRQFLAIVSRMTNYKKAIIRRSTISDYLLNPSKSKGKSDFFNELGYNMKNQSRFQQDIRNGLKTNKAKKTFDNKHQRIYFQVNMEMGLNKKKMVKTYWHIDNNSNIPILGTVIPLNKKKDKF